MASEIKLKRSGVSGNRPDTNDLSDGEIAVNTRDNIVFVANTTHVFEVGSVLTTNTTIGSTPALFVDTTNDRISVGKTGPSYSVDVVGDIALTGGIVANGSLGTTGNVLTANSTGGVYWGTNWPVTTETTLSTITQSIINRFVLADYGSGEFTIQATRSGDRQLTKLLVTHDSSVAYSTEYGTLITNAELFTTSVGIIGANVNIYVTGTSATSTTYKTNYELIES